MRGGLGTKLAAYHGHLVRFFVDYSEAPSVFSSANGTDFNGANLEATFAVGSIQTGNTACVNISITDDDALEGNHSFTVSLVSTTPSGVNISASSATTTVNIEDNDGK